MHRQPDDYALLDAGDGRRLERFGNVLLDRPAPAVEGVPRRDAEAWAAATARFERGPAGSGGEWLPAGALPASWTVRLDDLAFEARPTPAGQVGVFPEHAAVARWAAERAGAAAAASGHPAEVLNLFAYTGLATLTLARAGARVAHVDASRPAIGWARRNAALNELSGAPIRWLVEDAARFVAREARRGRRYDGVLLDPPTYGHGTGGAAWRLEADLEPLLLAIRPLLGPGPWFAACTAHAAGMPAVALVDVVARGLGLARGACRVRDLALEARSGARLEAGWGIQVTMGAEDDGR